MVLTLELKILFFEVLNTSYIYPITSKVRFVKGLANSTFTYAPNMIHICPNNIYTVMERERERDTIHKYSSYVWR